MGFAHHLETETASTNFRARFRVYLNTTYFAENWKYCNKIIFKCVNSSMRSIFNESFAEKEVCESHE